MEYKQLILTRTMLCSVLVFLLRGSDIVGGFNIDTKSAVVHRGTPGSMFGFSVALFRDGTDSWLLVGAPRAQTYQPNVTAGGAVYRCGLESTANCVPVPFDTTGSNRKRIDGVMEYTDDKSNQWFGATVRTSNENGLVVACAPRYVTYSFNNIRRDPIGNCWIARNSLASFEEYSPCKSWGFHKEGYCQAGMSAAWSEDGQRLFVGAPGSWHWQGQVFSRHLTSNDERKTRESHKKFYLVLCRPFWFFRDCSRSGLMSVGEAVCCWIV